MDPVIEGRSLATSGELRLAWTVEPGDRSTVVQVRGEVDLETQDEFDEAARAGLDTSAEVVILDLSNVTFMSSVGLRVLVQAHNEAQRTGRSVRVVDGTAYVKRLIDVTGLQQVLSVYPTLPAAQLG